MKNNKGYAVVNEDRLRFRADNNIQSKTLRYLDRGTIVSIVDKDENRIRIGELEDYWYNIEYEGINGWVFGYYLDIFTTYENAKINSRKYYEQSLQQDTNNYYEEEIKNNLFYISSGKLYQNITGKLNGANELKTESGLIINSYFFSNTANILYYIGKKSINDLNGNLYLYNIKKQSNFLLKKNIYYADINLDNNIIITVSIEKIKKNKLWIINLIYLNNQSEIKEISRIEQINKFEKSESDIFLKTLEREKGSLCYLKLDEKATFIYFKPPEELLYYLISIHDGKYIQVEQPQSNVYNIDSSRYIYIKSKEDEKSNRAVYSIVLTDKFSQIEKELVESYLYPINFSISKHNNLLAISMIDVTKNINDYYNSSIYVISLPTNSFIAISLDGVSYQPKWSNLFIN
ncbi:MAG: SH3 domain-containing protein [Spirochaetes bacterium]|nr:SH3 domain-containing protein [Spirochaetota bacterium]